MLSIGASAPISLAQATWTNRVQFALTGDGPGLDGDTIHVSATGVYTFVVRLGIFSLEGLDPGEANHGVSHWSGAVSATGLTSGETLGVTAATARFRPFDSGPSSFAGTLTSPSGIGSINCVRGSTISSAPWNWDPEANAPGPQPQHPVDWLAGPYGDHGAESFTNVWRFTVSVGQLNGSPIRVSLMGYAGPVAAWYDAGAYPPEGENLPGLAMFGIVTPGPYIRGVSSSLTIVRVPSPWSLIPVTVIVLAIHRRRDRTKSLIVP